MTTCTTGLNRESFSGDGYPSQPHKKHQEMNRQMPDQGIRKSPIISLDLESGATADFHLRIVRDSSDSTTYSPDPSSPDCAAISLTRPLSVPDTKSSRQKGGYVSSISRCKRGLSELFEPRQSEIIARSSVAQFQRQRRTSLVFRLQPAFSNFPDQR